MKKTYFSEQLFNYSFFHFHGRYPLIDRVRLAVFRSHTSHRQDGMALHRHPRTNYCFCTYPCSFLQTNLTDHEIKSAFLIIMISAQEQCSLRNHRISTNVYMCQIINPSSLSYPCIITNSQVPRIFHIYIRLYIHIFSYLGTKQTKQGSFYSAIWHPSAIDKPSIDKVPNQSLCFTTTKGIPAIIIF